MYDSDVTILAWQGECLERIYRTRGNFFQVKLHIREKGLCIYANRHAHLTGVR